MLENCGDSPLVPAFGHADDELHELLGCRVEIPGYNHLLVRRHLDGAGRRAVRRARRHRGGGDPDRFLAHLLDDNAFDGDLAGCRPRKRRVAGVAEFDGAQRNRNRPPHGKRRCACERKRASRMSERHVAVVEIDDPA